MQSSFFERFAHGALVRGLVDLEEAAGLRPQTVAGLDSAADQDQLAFGRDGERADDEAWVDVGDEAARRADEPIASLVVERPERRVARRSASNS